MGSLPIVRGQHTMGLGHIGRLSERMPGREPVTMNVIKSLWASVQGDPVFMRRLNGWLTIFWIVMIPISIVTGWINSVTYVAALSLWALVSGHWSAWQASRVEVKQEEIQEETDDIELDQVKDAAREGAREASEG